MNIGFISTRLAGVDGVSLETAKLAQVFRAMGHSIFYIAGELDADGPPGRLVPEMHFNDTQAVAMQYDAFHNPDPDPALVRQIYAMADHLRGEIETFIDEFTIDLLIPQNASTIPMNIALGVAIAETIRRRHIKTLCHHHDFYWERDRFISSGIQDILNDAFPPQGASVRHMTINTPMQRRLKAWRGIDALYLPNVFDFATPPPPPDDYAMSFRRELRLHGDDLIVLQPTRIIRRKGIEKAIELVRKLDDPRLILIITGYEGDEPGAYGDWLREEADRAGIRYKLIGDVVGSARRTHADGRKIFSLWDVYPHAHFVTYPSTYEGFGNGLIETIYFRKPFAVHTYPMYLSDIKPAGMQAVEFYHDITPDVLTQVRRLIDDTGLRERMTAHNYKVGTAHFSYDVLHRVLRRVLLTFE